MLTSAAGMMVLSGVTPGGTYFSSVLLGAVLSALGMGLTLVPATIVAMQGVERAQSGVASGLLNTSRLVGGALGLAVLSTIAAGQAGDAGGGAVAATNGFGLAFHVGALIALSGAVIAGFLLREPSDPEVVRVPRSHDPLPRTEEREHEALAA
jgi:MFS family permease